MEITFGKKKFERQIDFHLNLNGNHLWKKKIFLKGKSISIEFSISIVILLPYYCPMPPFFRKLSSNCGGSLNMYFWISVVQF
jgi:hypothetical protein